MYGNLFYWKTYCMCQRRSDVILLIYDYYATQHNTASINRVAWFCHPRQKSTIVLLQFTSVDFYQGYYHSIFLTSFSNLFLLLPHAVRAGRLLNSGSHYSGGFCEIYWTVVAIGVYKYWWIPVVFVTILVPSSHQLGRWVDSVCCCCNGSFQ